MRASFALAMMLLAAYAVATLQWWAIAPASIALLLETAAARHSS